MSPYAPERFTADEEEILRRYVSNLDGPVFALVNLPEVVKGALFARYSRSPKSLRRLFLDEFVGELDTSGDASVDATVGVERAEALYDRVFLEYGDDSVAQLGGVHLACEQASNLLTKVLEWGRLMSYLEQSTRYIAYDARLGGRYRYFRDPALTASSFGARFVGDMDRLFDAYAELVPKVAEHLREVTPKDPEDSDFIYRQAIRAKSFDAVRGVLPAASLSNVGIYASGQAYEQMLLRLRASRLPEAVDYADLMLTELRKVIPSFLKRVDLADRGVLASAYLADTKAATQAVARTLLDDDDEPAEGWSVQLVDFDPDGEVKAIAAMLYPHSHLSDAQLLERVHKMGNDERLSIAKAYVGDRTNRRHRPGRALERTDYRFDIVSDYGAFRDLQRHRLLTIEWQDLSPRHGYHRPDLVDEAGGGALYDHAMAVSARLHDDLLPAFPNQAPYAVALAYRIRYVMQMNAREAMHLTELRSAPQGHPTYRVVAQQMHRQIAEVAGHRVLAQAMSFVDHSADLALERLESERRAEQRRLSVADHGVEGAERIAR